jgi:hypothetical protein
MTEREIQLDSTSSEKVCKAIKVHWSTAVRQEAKLNELLNKPKFAVSNKEFERFRNLSERAWFEAGQALEGIWCFVCWHHNTAVEDGRARNDLMDEIEFIQKIADLHSFRVRHLAR